MDRAPRSIGEILSDAVSLLRRHFRAYYALALPFCTVDLLLREGGNAVMDAARRQLTGLELASAVPVLASLSGALGLIFSSLVVGTLLSVALIHLTAEVWAGRRPATKDALHVMVRRGPALVVTALLFLLALGLATMVPAMVVAVVGALLGTVGAVLGGVGAAVWVLVIALVLSLRWLLYPQATVVEERFAAGALSRSTALMAARGLPFFESPKVRLSLLFLVTFALSATLSSLFAGPRLIWALATGWELQNGLPPLLGMPLWSVVPLALTEVALQAVIAPLGAVLTTLFYFDLRVRFEGLDLDPPPSAQSALAA
jgi:hypothetical protein